MTQATYIQAGDTIDHRPGSDLPNGSVVRAGSLIGVTPVDIPANRLGALTTRGVFDVVKANEPVSAGDVLYWDDDGNPVGGTAGTGAATTTSTANTFIGFAMAAALAGDARVRVLWTGPVSLTNTVHNALTAAITDPGNAGAIPVTGSGICPLVSGGVETRTLAAPTNAGQIIALAMKTDAGDITVTCATGLNQAGNTTATFGDAGDTLVLVAVEVGSNKRWRVLSNDGVTLGGP